MNKDVYISSETHEDVTTGKLQIRRFQPSHPGLTNLLISTNNSVGH